MHSKVFCKSILPLLAVFSLGLGACSTNPATGEQQFDGLMSRESEASIGAQQHAQILKQYGGVYNNAALQAYVNEVGQRVAKNTERPEVRYTFTLLDSPVVNAFALPGGYVYITRGLLAVANDEAELAGVLGHEVGHITGRHQAARYSQSVLTSLGTAVIGAAVGDANISRALGVGNNLYISSYSRDQESQADQLGIRYLDRAGYDPTAMAGFLDAMGQYTTTESRIEGKDDQEFSYFSSHPQTADRVRQAAAEAGRYPKGSNAERDRAKYLSKIRGMTYGDSADQGLIRGNDFYHPKLGFAFSVPDGYRIVNQPNQVAAVSKNGTIIVLDMAKNNGKGPVDYMAYDWMKGERESHPESIRINGLAAATDQFSGMLNGRPVDIRVVAIEWSPSQMFRFQMAIPKGVGAGTIEDLKRTTYSFHRMTEAERSKAKPQTIQIVTAKSGDTIQTLARRMSVDKGAVERFLALNNLIATDRITSGDQYKIIN